MCKKTGAEANYASTSKNQVSMRDTFPVSIRNHQKLLLKKLGKKKEKKKEMEKKVPLERRKSGGVARCSNISMLAKAGRH